MSDGLSRRERQIMDILHRLGKATSVEVLDELDDAPTYSAVRATLRILEEKGHALHEMDGKRYVYLPAQPKVEAAKSAVSQVIGTFFGGSLEGLVRTFLSSKESNIGQEELDRIARMIESARNEEANR
jgi:predicted transcriptional regulator